MTREEISGWSVPVCVGIISLVLALILPILELPWSGWVYFSMAVLVPLQRFFQKRKRVARES
jgi:cation transport ATPase